MIATLINAAAVILGGVLGLVIGRRVREGSGTQEIVFDGIGIVTLIIGVMMALQTQRILYLALSLVFGGLLGHGIGIEAAISRLGRRLHALGKRRTSVPSEITPEQSEDLEGGTRFALGFLEASILFCVGSMTILGSLQAGAQGSYSILLTKSVMDGSMAVFLAAALGAGVLYSSLTILAYQGILTLAAMLIGPAVPELVLSEISGVGGAMLLMIGINLLGLKKIPTGNYLPALLFVVVLTLVDPYLPALLKQ